MLEAEAIVKSLSSNLQMVPRLACKVWQSWTPWSIKEGSPPVYCTPNTTFLQSQGKHLASHSWHFLNLLNNQQQLIKYQFCAYHSSRRIKRSMSQGPWWQERKCNGLLEAESMGVSGSGFKICYNWCHNHLHVIRFNSENLYACVIHTNINNNLHL